MIFSTINKCLMNLNSIAIIITIIVLNINCINCVQKVSNNNNNEIHNNWEQVINTSYILKDDLKVKLIQRIQPLVNISTGCRQSIYDTLDSFGRLEDWAYELLNSWGDFPPKGVIEGTITDFGDYDQCLSITPNQKIGQPQYCLVDIQVPMPEHMAPEYQNYFDIVDVLPKSMNKSTNNIFVKLSKDAAFFYFFFLRTGICTPNKCTKTDIKVMVEKSFENTGLKVKDISCELKTSKTLNLTQIFSISVFALFLLTAILSTVLLRIKANTKKNSRITQLLEAFSFEHNLRKVLTSESNQELKCIHGIRFITIIWVIFAHTIDWTYWGIFRKSFEMKYLLTSPENQVLLQAFYSVDTFFLISCIGFLLSRYIRLTPQVVFFIIFTFLIPLFGSGPVWNQHITPLVDNCQHNWWQNIIYLQNFLNEDGFKMCGLHTWFIAADMQFHWISVVVMIALHRRVRIGLIINALIIIAFFITPAVLIYRNGYPPSHILTMRSDFLLSKPEGFKSFNEFFWSPWSHGVVFFIGLAFGYFVYQMRSKRLSTISKVIIWSLVITSYVFIFYDSLFWAYGLTYGQSFSPLLAAFLYPFKKVLWAVNLTTIIWMCITGNATFINRFLSYNAFIPLSRLTYSVYLTHAWIVWIYWGSKRDLIDMKNFTILSLTSSVILISFCMSIIFSMLFEAPFFALQSYLKDYTNHKMKNQFSNSNNNSVKFESIYKQTEDSSEMTAAI